MVCNITRPSATDLFARYRQLFSNTVLGGAQVIEESNEWYAVAVNYAAAEEFYAITEQSWKERDPRQNCADNLVEQAAMEGVYPIAAIPAQGFLKLTGTAGTTLTSPLTFTVDGKQYVTAVNSGQPTAIDASGNAVVRVRAVIAGSAGNVTATTGTLDTAITNVNTAVEVCGGTFCSGSDTEATETFRARFLRRLQFQPRATNAWIKDKLLEWPCATRAITREGSCCSCGGCNEAVATVGSASNTNCQDCGCVECGGKLHFYLMFDNSFTNGIPATSVITEAETWMFGSPQGFGLGQVEIGVCGRIVPVTAVPVNVFVDIIDCPTSTQLAAVTTVVTEFFKTVEPSKEFNNASLEATLARTLGDIDFDLRVELVNATDGYGQSHGASDDDSKVYVSGCTLEPDCDYMLTLNSTTITRASDAATGCT